MICVITQRLPRPVAVIALLTGLLLGAAACGRGKPLGPHDLVSDTDLQRAAVLSNDPVLKNTASAPEVMPGKLHTTEVGWDRTQVNAQILVVHAATKDAVPTAATMEKSMADTVTTLRTGGWRVHWAVCVPSPALSAFVDPSPTPAPSPAPSPGGAAPSGGPSPSASPSPESELDKALTDVPSDVPKYDDWEEVVMVNKVVDGVSYWGMLVGAIFPDSGAFIELIMRAPNAHDQANLFAVTPPVLPAGSTCVEDGKPSTSVQAAGIPVVIKDWQAFPGASHSPDPHRL
jgi:hypothetical protein